MDVLQLAGVRMRGVSLRGFPLEAIDGTFVRERNGTIRVPGARARVAGHEIAAQGALGGDDVLRLSARGPLAGLDLPLARGRFAALASLRGSLAEPALTASLASADLELADGPAAGLPFALSGEVREHGGGASVHDALLTAPGAVARLSGAVGDVESPRSSDFRVKANLHDADLATLARAARLRLPHPEGLVDANLLFAGRGAHPRVRGTLALPEGSLNGLPFSSAHLAFDGTPSVLGLDRGDVQVGTTRLTLSGAVVRGAATLDLAAPTVDLADFDDYFDPGDLLAGRGSLALSATLAPDALVTSGELALSGVRYRRYTLGTANARWSTSGRALSAHVSLAGPLGDLDVAGGD
ncbi:MAG: hypothetical protein ACREQ5_30085, partial [Candidatus Dormibacteria bacterium]